MSGGAPRALLAAGLLLLAAAPRAALADGAFPDSTRLFLPAGRPEQMILATNFGLVVSEDRGGAWTWACELAAASDAFGYQLGPGPGYRLFAVAGSGAAISTDDLGCSWTVAATAPAGARVLDLFPDPASDRRVFAAAVLGADAADHRLLVSSDGGHRFDTVLYRPPPMAAIIGVESARSRPDTIYVTLRQGPGSHPRVVRTRDGGETWQTFDVEAVTGAFDLRIIAVDPDDAGRIFFRVRGYPDETLAVSDDGGETVRIAARIPRGVLSAFGRRAEGTILLAGTTTTGGLVLSAPAPGGVWTPWARSPLARDFTERAGTLYLVGDDLRDRFAIAASSSAAEDGTTLRPVLRFADISAIRACAARPCATACAFEVARGNLSPSTCQAPVAPDAGPPDAATTAVEGGAAGCACAAGRKPAPAAPLAAGAVLLLLRALRDSARAARARADRRGAGP